ncbi:MAG: MotA/TolQ/ExbB proton channel family protein [Thermodesulfobacteriota bacterium]
MANLFESGGFLMYPLLLCSIVSLTVIIERVIFWLSAGMETNRKVIERIFELTEKEDFEGVKKAAEGSKSYVVRVLLSGILHRDYDPVKAMELAVTDEFMRMKRYMGILDTIITVAPLLGILGTVAGIIESFDMLGAGGIEHPQAVTGGIAKALITTASGLAIAIITVFPYNYFNSRIERAGRIIEKYTTSFEIRDEINRCEKDCSK